ncbi:FtsW/RodA/SpoVE family cell cycle protein [Clostridium sp. DL1XJH146]
MLEKLTINKKLLKELDYGLIITSIIIVCFGCINIGIASSNHYAELQFIWLLLSLAVVYCVLLIDYSRFMNFAPFIYWAGIILLFLNDFLIGTEKKGAQAWISLGSRAIQPSEFAKLGMILMIASLLQEMKGDINRPANFFKLAFYAVLPMALIVIQPDMGMTMVCFFIVLGIFFTFGFDMRVIIGGLLSIVILIAVIWNSGIMPEYWKARLTSFLNPDEYSMTFGWQLNQSIIGIGSGQIYGEIGENMGDLINNGKTFNILSQEYKDQSLVSTIPEAFTDFIFAAVCLEWGFVGAMIFLLVYGFLIFRMISIARNSKDIFGAVVTIGVCSTFIFSILQNIGMTIGIMPITGITLPFMSYGGSSLLSNFIGVAIVLNIGMRKKKIVF